MADRFYRTKAHDKDVIERLQFLLSNLSGYAALLEDAADAIEGHREPDAKSEFDAGLLRGLADRLRELNAKQPANEQQPEQQADCE